ncbi:hypothetical protein AB3662_28945 [Sorangium cellulosum]|uniref:hypothetical protein n=1 Tax=Sorangium cellulosum TaxID=56 RepID=UPI003D9A6462
MRRTTAAILFLMSSPWTIGCGTAPELEGPGEASCGDGSCQNEPPPESVCLEHLAADILDDGCGVFVAGLAGGGDDRNPGTKAKPVFSVQRAVDIAREGRGRVFVCSDGFEGNVRLPAGVDLHGGYNCWRWGRDPYNKVSTLQVITNSDPVVIVEPASPGDPGTADGVSTIAYMRMRSNGPISVVVRSSTVVEILRSEVMTSHGWGGGDGEEWPWPERGEDGPDGSFGADGCSAATVAGGAAVMNLCGDGASSTGGKGGDGLPDSGEDGGAGAPAPMPNPTSSGRGGHGDREGSGCHRGSEGISGAFGTVGAAGEGIGRITEMGWEGDRAADGSRGMPGQGGGGGGGLRGGLAACGVATLGGASGGAGGAGGCGGRGGRGGGNGRPSIGIVALHAELTVRDTVIMTSNGGQGGNGGPPEQGGKPGRGGPGAALSDGRWACAGGKGGYGGTGGYGGPGRGGDSIGIAYVDEDQLTLEGVGYELAPPGKGGMSWNHDGSTVSAEDGVAVETLRFPEP